MCVCVYVIWHDNFTIRMRDSYDIQWYLNISGILLAIIPSSLQTRKSSIRMVKFAILQIQE